MCIISTYYGPTADVAYYRKRLECLNWWALIGGILMGYSSMATGCFRYADSYLAHNTAASGIFFITPLYMLVNTYFAGLFVGFVNTRTVFFVRLFISCLAVTLALVFISTEITNSILYHDFTINPLKRLFWTRKDPGFFMHVLNSVTEWAYLLLLSPYVYTFVDESSRMSFDKLQCQYAFIDDEKRKKEEENV